MHSLLRNARSLREKATEVRIQSQNIALNLCFLRPRLKSVAVKNTKKCGGRLAEVCPGSHQQASIHRWPSREQLPATIKIGKGNTRSTHFPLRSNRGTQSSTCTSLRDCFSQLAPVRREQLARSPEGPVGRGVDEKTDTPGGAAWGLNVSQKTTAPGDTRKCRLASVNRR